RLVQAGGGRIVSISGKGRRGHDIRWITGQGQTVLIERKDRAYEPGLNDTAEKRVARVLREVCHAGPTIPEEPGAARILVVGFQHLVRPSEAEKVDRQYREALQKEFASGFSPKFPNFLVIEHHGLEPKTNGDKFNYFSPHALFEED